MTVRELAWVDGFIRRIRKHLFVRGEDNVLILPPNRVYKLNPTAVVILDELLAGKRIRQVRGISGGSRAEDVHHFFCDLKAFYLGCGSSTQQRRATGQIPFGFDFTRLPILGELAVTYRCNLKCRFCYLGVSREDTGPAAEEMSLQQAKQVIDIFKQRARIPFFSFTGGEPLLHPDLEKMLAYAVRRGLGVNLITNGTLAGSKRSRTLYRRGLRTAQVSLEGPDPAVHDRLTGVPGSFKATLAGIRHLRAAGISVQTNTTLNRLNAGSVDALPALLQDLGIRRFSMNLYIPAGAGLPGKGSAGGGCGHGQLFYPYAESGKVIDRIRRRADTLGLTFFWYSPLPHCYYNPLARGLGNKSCAAMDGLLSVTPAGDVRPCSAYPESVGNILAEDFNAVWFSARAAFFKQKRFAPEECRACDMFTACQSACPLYWQYAGTGELAGKWRELNRSCETVVMGV